MGYQVGHIPNHSCLHVNVSFATYCTPAKFCMLYSGTPTLGRDLFTALIIK